MLRAWIEAAVPRSGELDVLHVLWSGHVGGIERQVAAVTRAANEQQSRVHRVCFLDGRGPVGDELEREGIAVRLRMNTGVSPIGLWRLTRLLRRARPGVLHLHTASLGAHLMCLMALPRTSRVYTEHFPQVLECAARVRLLYGLHRRTGTRFVALSEGMAQAMEFCGLDSTRITVIPNAVRVPLRGETASGATSGTIGFVGRLVEQQKVDLLIDVVAELARRGTSHRAILVGDGPARAGLERYALDRGVGERVRFAGEQEDVVPWLDRMDVFLSTREYATYPLALLEAMARGAPVVALAARGGLAEIAARGGLLLPGREVGPAADAVEVVLSSADERDRLRARGFAVAAEHSIGRVLPQLDALYAACGSKGTFDTAAVDSAAAREGA